MKSFHITENAVRNHEELFPNLESKLQKTDPEFIALFDNWAFDEVIRQSRLDTKTRVMLILASTIAAQALGEYKVMVGAALNVGLTPVEIKEVLYQSVPYVGVAKVFDFLHATNAVFQERGMQLPLEGQSTTTAETRFAKGVAAQKAIFGEAIDKMRQQAPQDQLHIQDFLAANCFGDYYTRNGIDLKMRELLTFAMLISLGGCEPQVKGHVTGNLRVGNDRMRLIDVVTQLLPYIGYPRTLNALRAIDEVVPPTNATNLTATAH
jgi:4-carboxymuconolactone decarboxylase